MAVTATVTAPTGTVPTAPTEVTEVTITTPEGTTAASRPAGSSERREDVGRDPPT